MMKILKEITADWNMDSDVFPNHTYLLNSKGQIVAFAKLGGDNITELKSRIYLDKRYRKFVEIKHAGLSKLIPKYNKIEKQADIKPEYDRLFKVKSKDNVYDVILKNNRLTCSCAGFTFRGKCKHITAVAEKQQLTGLVGYST